MELKNEQILKWSPRLKNRIKFLRILTKITIPRKLRKWRFLIPSQMTLNFWASNKTKMTSSGSSTEEACLRTLTQTKTWTISFSTVPMSKEIDFQSRKLSRVTSQVNIWQMLPTLKQKRKVIPIRSYKDWTQTKDWLSQHCKTKRICHLEMNTRKTSKDYWIPKWNGLAQSSLI